MRTYVPPRERRASLFRFKISFPGMIVCVIMFFSVISVVSAVQSSFVRSSVRVTEKNNKQAEITDNIRFAQATQEEIIAARFVDVPVILSNLPVERAWPVRGRLTTYYSGYHPAIDIATGMGTPIHPFASGVVVKATSGGCFGRYVIIKHNQNYESVYAHLGSINVTVGQEVNLSTVIGTIGSTGCSTGPHLHLQINKDGLTVNPLRVLP